MSRITEFLIGDTVKLTWVNSGVTVSGGPTISLRDGAETIVNTMSLTSSGDGHYYGFMTLPGSSGLYVMESVASISGYPFKRRAALRTILQEVD